MKALKRLFGGLELTWPRVIAAALIAGAYTGLMAMLPITKDTSFRNIAISFEGWILLGVLIIMNSRSPLDSALKCFVFFLISQPLCYLVQVPFSSLGWGIMDYYRNWIIWTLLTLPMGYFGWYLKKDKWWGLLILTPPMLLLGYQLSLFAALTAYWLPHHLLSTLFCIAVLILCPLAIFEDKKVRTAGLVISGLIILAALGIAVLRPNVYNTTVLTDGGDAGAVFDGTYSARLEDESFGTVSISYNENIESWMVDAGFRRGGRTNLILEDAHGGKTVYELDIGYSNFTVTKK